MADVTTPSTRTGEAPPPAPPAAPKGGPPDVAPIHWTQALDPEAKSYVETKGYKEVSDVVKAQRSLETLLGGPRERLMKLPEKGDDPAWGDVYKRLGKPEKADDYTVPVGQDGKPDAFGQWARDTFHKANLTKAQGDALVAQFSEFQKAQETARVEQFQTLSNDQLAKLKQEWGAAYDRNIAAVNKILGPAGLNLTEDEYHRAEGAFGVDGWAKFVHNLVSKLGVKVGEAPFVRGEGGGGPEVLTPDEAKAQIKALEKDTEFIQKLAKGDADAREKLTRLNKAAFPGEVTA